MKLVVFNWFMEALKVFLGRVIEFTFRVVLFLLPLGLFMLILQLRSKVSSVSNLTVYTKAESVWQHVFPGFILVAIDPKQLERFVIERKTKTQRWIAENKYILALIFMVTVVVLMIYFGGKS